MTVRQQLIYDIEKLNPFLLNQVFNFTEQLLKVFAVSNLVILQEGNLHLVLKYSGMINDDEALELTNCINEEFSNLEGVW
jgi:hypothetical protein